MKIRYIALALSIGIINCILTSCRDKGLNNVTHLKRSDIKEQKLHGNKIYFDSLIDSRQMIHYKNYIFCEKIKSENLIIVLNLNTGKKEFEFLRKGRGPGEMLDIADLKINPHKQELLVFDGISLRFNVYNLDSLVTKKTKKPILSREITGNEYTNELIKINDSIYLGPGLSSRLNYYNSDGQIIKKTGDYSLYHTDEKDIWLTQIYRGHICYNYTEKKIAFLNEITDVIEFYQNDTIVKILKGPDHFNANYKIVSINGGYALAHLKEKTHIAYNNTWNNDEYIFTLYSGEEWGNTGFHHSNILCFSWDGNLQNYYKLDIPAAMISIDVENKTIYGLNVENEKPFITEFKF